MQEPLEVALRDSSLINGIYLGAITGGESTNPMWTSEVGNVEFGAALRESLRSHGLLNKNPQASEYTLAANLLGLKQPGFGLDLTVTSHVDYELVYNETGNLYLGETISASYTATPGDSFLAVERLRLANEGSIRKNIETFLVVLFGKEPR